MLPSTVPLTWQVNVALSKAKLKFDINWMILLLTCRLSIFRTPSEMQTQGTPVRKEMIGFPRHHFLSVLEASCGSSGEAWPLGLSVPCSLSLGPHTCCAHTRSLTDPRAPVTRDPPGLCGSGHRRTAHHESCIAVHQCASSMAPAAFTHKTHVHG